MQPQPAAAAAHCSGSQLLVVLVRPPATDDAYKIKAYNPDTELALATATYLGPTFGEPINHLLPFRWVTLAGLLFCTEGRTVRLGRHTVRACLWPPAWHRTEGVAVSQHRRAMRQAAPGSCLCGQGVLLCVSASTLRPETVWLLCGCLPAHPACLPAGLSVMRVSRPGWRTAQPSVWWASSSGRSTVSRGPAWV